MRQNQTKWLLLLYSLPTSRSAERVSLWRRLKRLGAVPFKTSAYLLPDNPTHFEQFQWLAQQVRQGGGDATLIRVTEVEGLSQRQIVEIFNDARSSEYGELMRELNKLLKQSKRGHKRSFETSIERFTKWLEQIEKADFFDCTRGHDARLLMKRVTGLTKDSSASRAKLSANRFVDKTWLTRPRPEIDRVGSAWLIRRFIDPKARFVFGNNPAKFPNVLPFDMIDAEFSHHGDDCTFETLMKRFGIADRALSKIAEMVHEADLEDGKFQRTEAIGLDRVFKGWAKIGLTDEQLLAKGAECFEALYQFLRK